jgi:hypothetical protein
MDSNLKEECPMRYFKMMRILFLAVVLALGMASFAQAITPIAATVSGSGSYNNSASLLADGTIAAEGTSWTAGTNAWWYGLEPYFTLDFGSAYNVNSMLVSVDNNDSYQVQYSLNGVTFYDLFAISSGAGNVTWGMDTFGTSENIFSAVDARYIRIFAIGGDNMYAVSEVQAFGRQSDSVPEPATMLLLGLGILGLAGIRRMK